MADEDKQSPFKESYIFPWFRAMDMWLDLIKATPAGADTDLGAQKASPNRFTGQMDTNINLLRSLSRMIREPESASAMANSFIALPEIFLKMANSGFEAALQIQNHLIEKAGKIGKSTQAYKFDNLDQEVFEALNNVYEKELRQYFKIPPLGPARFYQERFNEMLDKYNLFENMLAEFLSVLYLPMEKSFRVFQEKLEQLAEEGNFPRETKESYAIWIKILEGHYINLFKSSEYTDVLHRMLGQLEDFIAIRNKTMEDFLQLFPIVTDQDVDDLYKEFHLLKKRVKELEKQLGISPNTLTAVK
ncbi:MAG TPA: poly(R)-hydroxyalkanoic acid synthase subunit PhaE [Smithella sp.]|nr:poly(R)-hydroxyalkanoic acid synthase subunit PhaE [Smithella sp.]